MATRTVPVVAKSAVAAATSTREKSRAGRATRGQGSWTSAGKTPGLLLKIHAGGLAGDLYSEKQAGAQLVDSNMLGRTARERLAEFQLDSARRPKVKKNLILHVSMSRPAGWELTLIQWLNVARKFLKAIGADGCQYMCTRHTQTKNDHIHLTFSRVTPMGKLVSMSQNRWQWRQAVRMVERDLGLTDIVRPVEKPTSPTDSAVNAKRRALRRGTTDAWIDPLLVSRALAQASSPEQFAKQLKNSDIEIKAARKADGTAKGILFRKTGAQEWLAGSTIGRDFSLKKIQTQLAANLQAAQHRDKDSLLQRQREAFEQRRRKPIPQSIHRPQHR